MVAAVGAMLRAAELRMVVLVDGFSLTANFNLHLCVNRHHIAAFTGI